MGGLPVDGQVGGLGEDPKTDANGGLVGKEGGDGLEEGVVVEVGEDPVWGGAWVGGWVG